MRKILLGLILMIGLLGCGEKKEEKKVEQSKLLFYAGMQEDYANLIAKEFEKETGIKTEFIRLNSGEAIDKLKSERNNMIASVWCGGSVEGIISASEEGLIEPYKSPESNEILEEFRDHNGVWTGIYSGYLGFSGNKKKLSENNIKMPTSWDDLLKPEYKGKIVVGHPGSSGTAYTMLATLVQIKGEEEAMEYMKKFNNQVKLYTTGGPDTIKIIEEGEATIGINYLHDVIRYQKKGYKNMIIGVPLEGTGFEIGGVALLKGGPDQENGKKFIDWVLKAKTQELGKTIGAYQFVTNKNAFNPEETKEVVHAKLIKYDFDWAGKNRKRLVERFIKETGVKEGIHN